MRALIAHAVVLSTIATATQAAAQYPRLPRDAQEVVPVFRFFHPGTSDHLYTIEPEAEARVIQQYKREGIEFYVATRPGPDLVPLYRYYKPHSKGHYYATSRRAGERFHAELESLLGYIAAEPRRGLVPLHEWYNPDADRHFYTTQPSGEHAPRAGYRHEGVVGYVVAGVKQ